MIDHKRQTKLRGEFCEQHLFDRLQTGWPGEISNGSDLQAGITAWIDARERLKLHIHVERQSVKRPPVAHADSQRGDFGIANIHTRRAFAAHGNNVPFQQRVDDRLLDAPDILDTRARRCQGV